MPPGSASRPADYPDCILTSTRNSGLCCRRSCSWRWWVRPSQLPSWSPPSAWRGTSHGAIDFRAVQRAVATEGVGNLLAGFVGTMPNTPHAGAVAATEITGVAARRVGITAGLALLTLTFLPKALASILAIPVPVVAATITVVMVTLFMVGMREVVRSMSTSPRNGLIAGASFWTGVAFEFDLIFPAYFAEFAGGLLNNSLTTGALVALLLTALTARRKRRFHCKLDAAELPRIREFIQTFTARSGLESVVERLEAASEEALLTLLQSRNEAQTTRNDDKREMLLTVSEENGKVVLEFRVGHGCQRQLNLQDQLAWLGEQTDVTRMEQEVSLRLLRHLASSVRHQQFHDMNILTLYISAATPPRNTS